MTGVEVHVLLAVGFQSYWAFLRQISYDFLVTHIIFMSSDSVGGNGVLGNLGIGGGSHVMESLAACPCLSIEPKYFV